MLNKWLSMQIISTAVWQARVSQAWLVPKELTCKYIVVVVDVVQFDPFIQHVKLICSQHLALPVRVTWVMTDHRSDTYKSHLKIHRPLRLPLICMGYEQKPRRFVRDHWCCPRELWWCHSSGESPACFLLLGNRTEESLRGWRKKTHHCRLDVCVSGRKWLRWGICDKTGVCRHHFLCNASPLEPQSSLIPNASPARIMQILDFTPNHAQHSEAAVWGACCFYP